MYSVRNLGNLKVFKIVGRIRELQSTVEGRSKITQLPLNTKPIVCVMCA